MCGSLSGEKRTSVNNQNVKTLSKLSLMNDCLCGLNTGLSGLRRRTLMEGSLKVGIQSGVQGMRMNINVVKQV